MRKLDAELGIAVAAAMRDHARKRRFAVVRIKPEAAMGDAPAALDAGRLHHDQRRPRITQHAEVVHVPVGRNAIVGAVLAHGRNDDPVSEVESSEPDWGKKSTGHGALDQSGRRALTRAGIGLHMLRRIRAHGRNLSPALAGPDGVPQAVKELLLRVIALPAPAMKKLDQMRPPAIGKRPPFPGNLLECRRGKPLRHGNAVGVSRESRCAIVQSKGCTGNLELSERRSVPGTHIDSIFAVFSLLRDAKATLRWGADA